MTKRNTLREALLFIGMTLGCSYIIFWGPLAVLKIPTISFVSDTQGPVWAIILFMLGGFVPSVAAFILTALREGRAGIQSLGRRFTHFRIGLRWYLVMVAVVLLGTAGQIALNSLQGYGFDFTIFLAQLPSFLPLIIIGPISEEFGWRGYLLPRLQNRWNALTSSIVVGTVWALWHLPLFYIPGTSQRELHLPFLSFLAGLIALSIIMTWIDNNTSNSIWAAVFFHWIYTYAAQVQSTGVTRSPFFNRLEYVPYIVLALLIVVIWKPANLSAVSDTDTVMIQAT